MTAPIASGGSEFAGWALHPLESAALPRRTPEAVIHSEAGAGKFAHLRLLCHAMPGPEGFSLELSPDLCFPGDPDPEFAIARPRLNNAYFTRSKMNCYIISE
jgi:hypothetical protein